MLILTKGTFMIEIIEVKTKKERKEFVEFPNKLYKNNPYFCPAITADELSMFDPKKNVSYEDCEAKYFLAKENGKVVGRIAGIIQKLYNNKTGEKRVRFSRFDCINDEKVAKALFNAVENYAREKGMNLVHGPLGFNDLDREAMLIEGFDKLSTFEEQYNYPYYPELMEKCGYAKEVDYVEYKLYKPAAHNERVNRIADAVMKKYNLRYGTAKNMTEYINKYKDGIFAVIDEVYAPLYGTIPFTDKLRNQIISQFRLFLNQKLFMTIVDENDKVVAFGFAIPSITKVIQKTKGKIIHPAILKIFKAIKKPEGVDLALTGVLPEYRAKGVNALIMKFFIDSMIDLDIKWCETNLNLEDNSRIQNQWKNFKHERHKRRRCYIKNLNNN